MFFNKRKIAFLLLFCMIISTFSTLTLHEHEILASVWGGTCPQGGSAVLSGYVGCSVCGGSGRVWTDSRAGIGDNMICGSGLWGTSTEVEQGVGTWTVYYRCYNCGVCPKNSIPAKKVLTTSSSPAYSVGYEINLQGAAPGYVPQRWCSACGPDLKAAGDTWLGREASYTVYHISIKQIEPEDTKFTVTVTYDKGGIAYANKTEYSKGDTVNIYADPDETHIFTKWTVKSRGPLTGIGTSSANTSFVMPEKDVTVHAGFDKKPNPPATNPPVEDLTTPEPTSAPVTNPPSPTPQPTPTVTPEPTVNYPTEDSFQSSKYNHYFTTSEGITLGMIYNRQVPSSKTGEGFGKTCTYTSSTAKIIASSMSLTSQYKIGVDGNGNEWYFREGRTMGSYTQPGKTIGIVEALYVHPKTYNGHEVDSANIRYITELTFPNTLTLKGVDTATANTYAQYQVISIGGGFSSYNTSYPISGTAEQYDNSVGVYGESMFKALQYNTKVKFGVIGNGEVTSSGLDLLIYPNYTEDRREFKNNHYVYNTSLQKVTIPATVTTILPYAFYNCQALTEIIGGASVTTIGENAFSGAEHIVPGYSEWWNDKDYEYTYYNGALYYSGGTTATDAWKKSVALSSFMALPEFPKLLTIESEAFTRRTNLLNVELPSCLETIEKGAFAKCKLGSIKIPGETTVVYDVSGKMTEYDTLGTVSTGQADDDKTLIITNPDTAVIDYGVKYWDYYSIRAGYPITYVKNATPNETYTSISEIEIVKAEIARYSRSAYMSYPETSGTVFIDINGMLYVKLSTDIYATEIAPGIKFVDAVHGIGGNFGIAEDGTVYKIDVNAKTWTKLAVPEGSTCHQWTEGQIPYRQDYSTVDGNGNSNSGTSYSYTYNRFLYFLEPSGQISRINLATNAKETISQPAGTAISFFEVALNGGGGYKEQYAGSVYGASKWDEREYDIEIPTMLVHDSDGNVWIGSASKMEYYETSSAYNQAGNYVTNSDKSSGYVESEWTTPILALSKCSWEEASADNRHTQWILQGKGSGVGQNGYRTSDQYAYYTVSNTGDVYYTYNSATFAALTGKNITEIKNYGAYVLLFGADGTVWVTVANTGDVNSTSFYRMTAKSLFSGADVAKVWTETSSNSFVSGNDSNGTPHYGVTTTQTLVVLDSKGRYWKAVYNVIQAEGWNGSSYTGTTETSYRWDVVQMTSVDKEKYPSGNDVVPIRTEYVEYLWKCMFERPGYTFKHWTPNADGTGISYLPSERYVITEATTIYAQWVPAKNILRYRPNGGVGIIPEETYELTATKALIKENAYTRKGYEFTGWNTQADGKGTSYQSGQYIPLVQEGITYLYAQWKKVSSYTIQVSKNDISVRPVVLDTSKTKTLTADQIYTMPDGSDISFQVTYDLQGKGVKTGSSTPTVTLTSANTDGYLTFSGWLLFEKVGTEYDFTGKRYNAGAQASNLGTKDKSVMTLFPYYSGDAATVLLPLPACVGYNFIGWGKTTKETDPGKLYHIEEDVEPIYQPSGNETLYAYWEAKTYGISLIATHPQASEGEIIQTQSSVLMTYDKELPTVRIPQSERFVFLGYYDKLDSDGIPTVDAVQYYDMNGMAVTDEGTGKPQTWTIDDGSVTTLYAYLVSEVEITLDGRGATKQEQTRVTMTYDEFGPNVIPPEKTGYVFGGYYTGLRGSGKKYYDTLGESVSVWRENGTDVLYAYWIQNPVEIPEKDDTEAPESMPTDRMEVKVALDEATVQVYADDGNPVTGADTDLPPYQVEDIVRDGILESAGGIPSTEQVAVRAKMGSWLLSCVLERKSGVDNVRILVTVPYRTQYEDTEDESLIISDVQYETMEVIVPKAWSYWAIQEGGIYFPESMDAENGALKGGKLNVPVIWDDEQAVQKPSYRLAVYGEKEQHIKWPSYDEENRPVLSLMLTEEEYIVSEIPGELPDVREYLTNVCYNAAWRDATQYTVKSDGITVAGVTLLSDSEGPMGEGRTPDRNMLSELKSRIEETSYHQTYKSGILLEKTSANGRYDTKAEIIYVAADENVGSEREKSIPATKVNEINIHAPVVCMPIMEADHEDMYQCETVPFGHEVLVLDDEWKHSEFVLQITNAGYHSDKFGYGNRDYSGYLAQRDGKEQNEVCFPFAVWLDSGNDEDITNDMLLEAGEWYVLGTDTQRFYLPVDTQEGSYDIKCRSVAVNGEGYEDKTEIRSNTQPAHYVAESVIKFYVTGRLYNFTVYEVQGTAAWNDVTDGVKYSVGLGSDDADLWETLPLRKGVHPLYRNVGGLPVGGSFGFSVTGIGTSFTESTSLKVVPQLSMVTEEGYKEVDIYFEKEEDNGVFLQLWNSEDETMLLTIADAGESAVQVWEGTFSLPDRLYVAEKGTEVLRYQERFGLSFTEEFWEKDARLMLRFALTIENAQGEILYYGMIPERIVNNIWQTEAEASYREDIDGNRYEIQGGEVAVIDPGDRAGNEDTTHGIY